MNTTPTTLLRFFAISLLALAAVSCSKESNYVRVQFETSKGDFVVEVRRSWAPKGAERFLELVREGYYDECRFFRVMDGFMVQFGINGDPAKNQRWRTQTIEDDRPVGNSNVRSTLTFATGGPNTRTTQIFINTVNNQNLDADGFVPFGLVTEGMKVVDSLYSGYGEGAPRGRGPSQELVQTEGNAFLKQHFPKLDSIHRALILSE